MENQVYAESGVCDRPSQRRAQLNMLHHWSNSAQRSELAESPSSPESTETTQRVAPTRGLTSVSHMNAQMTTQHRCRVSCIHAFLHRMADSLLSSVEPFLDEVICCKVECCVGGNANECRAEALVESHGALMSDDAGNTVHGPCTRDISCVDSV